VLDDGSEITYGLYEKRKEKEKEELPKLQKSLSVFPDFEEEKKKAEDENDPNYVPWIEDDKKSDSWIEVLERIAIVLEKIEKKIK